MPLKLFFINLFECLHMPPRQGHSMIKSLLYQKSFTQGVTWGGLCWWLSRRWLQGEDSEWARWLRTTSMKRSFQVSLNRTWSCIRPTCFYFDWRNGNSPRSNDLTKVFQFSQSLPPLGLGGFSYSSPLSISDVMPEGSLKLTPRPRRP